MHEAPGTQGSFTKSNVAIDGLSVEKGSCHLHDAVRFTAAERELVIGLLVASGIAAGSSDAVLAYQKNIIHSESLEPAGCIVSGSSCSDYACIDFENLGHRRLMWNPPSTSM